MMEVTLQQARENNLRVVIDYENSQGENVEVHGELTNNSSNPQVASYLSQRMFTDEEGPHYEVIYELHPVVGSTQLSGFGDADLGDGVRQVDWSALEPLEVVASEATQARVTVGELVPKAPPA